MDKIYFDNASTTFPKPPQVAQRVYHYISHMGMNISRGCYQSAYQVEEIVFETRQLLCDLFHGDAGKNVVFTKNITESLNLLLKGYLRPGDHVLVSAMEHNAVMRPLTQLSSMGIGFSRIPCAPDGSLLADRMESLLQKNTKAVIMTHASNVCGTVLPITKVGQFCKAHQLRFFVDAAQTAGVLPVDMQEMQIDALAFTGHKGLLGPQGIGGLLLREDMPPLLEPLVTGGTGSISHMEQTPDFMPDRFEGGTMNLPGIIGLHAGLQWLRETGIHAVYEHESSLTGYFLEGLRPMETCGLVHTVGKKDVSGRTGVVSLQTPRHDPAQISFQLDSSYGIMTRVGLHCAPYAHKTLGTYPTGTIRFSFGWWNTEKEVDTALKALRELLNSPAG